MCRETYMNVAMTEMQKVKRVLFVAPSARHSRTTGKLQVHVHCNQSNNCVTAELTKQAHYYSPLADSLFRWVILLIHFHSVEVIQEDYHPLQRYKQRLKFLRYCCSSWLEHSLEMGFKPNEMLLFDMLSQYIMSEHQFNTFRRMWAYTIRGLYKMFTADLSKTSHNERW